MGEKTTSELLATIRTTLGLAPTVGDKDGNCASSIQPDIVVYDISKVAGYRIGQTADQKGDHCGIVKLKRIH
jgi:hypothetical protein